MDGELKRKEGRNREGKEEERLISAAVPCVMCRV